MNWEILLSRSYVPYSGQQAACLVKGQDNRFYPGVRIENIAFPDTIDEKQIAIFTCLSEGDKPSQLIIPKGVNTNSEIIKFWEKEYNLTCVRIDDIDNIPVYEEHIPLNIEIKKCLIELLDKAVVPHSDFPVSALVKTPDGFISGVNIECSEWRLGLCAERLAISKAISQGKHTLQEIYVHTRFGEFSSPCGACRQVMIEHMPHHPVHLFHSNGSESFHITSHLLPYSFQSSTLHKSNQPN